ncbi:MAG: zinc transporter [Limimaricola sp.]|uniref:zinc ABC transporter substrate-binding protein n=1 Tax=Limimaricola sp. TaxID=2211665 RepID=UPI001D5FED2A|nr:zinc ABC transporter substrate-binding protein [Limimaricola sp.]MBI1416286.1 zinc transporter [Limimaricola sp.]
MIRFLAAALLSLSMTAARAEVPKVMTDIAPIQSLVDRVMAGLGSADVLLPPGASPHDYALRPSDAGRLADAGLVIWMGPGLEPWLADPLATLAPNATRMALLDSSGWDKLVLRGDAALFDGDPEDHPGETDPHAWLDPVVAAEWMQTIAAALSAADPANAATYAANAKAGAAEMQALVQEVSAQLAGVPDKPYLVPHDGYHYFEQRFARPAAGAVTLSDAVAPGPSRIAELQARVAAGGIACVLTDPETSTGWADVLRQGTTAKTASVDPMGASIPRGAGFYPALIRSIADALAQCLS